MSIKKKDLPAMPFYFGDWRKAPEIRALDLDVRMIWFEMMGYMWESTERGYLTINNNPVITPVIARLIGIDITTMEAALKQMEQYNVYSRRSDGAIYSRKIVKDEQTRLSKSEAGKKGMDSRYGKNSVITKPITNTEYEYESINEYDNEIYKWWNEKKIITHHKLTDKIKTKINTVLKDYSIEQIKTAITNYSIIVNDDQYYFKYKWTLRDFLQRGLDKFMDLDIAKSNYRSIAIDTKERKHDVSNEEYKDE